jgi:hypothetical protein
MKGYFCSEDMDSNANVAEILNAVKTAGHQINANTLSTKTPNLISVCAIVMIRTQADRESHDDSIGLALRISSTEHECSGLRRQCHSSPHQWR